MRDRSARRATLKGNQEVAMRGDRPTSQPMYYYFDLEQRIRPDHPLRPAPIRGGCPTVIMLGGTPNDG